MFRMLSIKGHGMNLRSAYINFVLVKLEANKRGKLKIVSLQASACFTYSVMSAWWSFFKPMFDFPLFALCSFCNVLLLSVSRYTKILRKAEDMKLVSRLVDCIFTTFFQRWTQRYKSLRPCVDLHVYVCLKLRGNTTERFATLAKAHSM